mgnify:CR=1 FL=1
MIMENLQDFEFFVFCKFFVKCHFPCSILARNCYKVFLMISKVYDKKNLLHVRYNIACRIYNPESLLKISNFITVFENSKISET